MSEPSSPPSAVTAHLIALLTARDAVGKAKYAGKTLDRTDLTIEEWLDHGIEELLDAAGYAQAVKREIWNLRAALEAARRIRDMAEAQARWIEGVRVCDDVKKLTAALPPDILMAPLPLPDRLDYAGKMIQVMFDRHLERYKAALTAIGGKTKEGGDDRAFREWAIETARKCIWNELD